MFGDAPAPGRPRDHMIYWPLSCTRPFTPVEDGVNPSCRRSTKRRWCTATIYLSERHRKWTPSLSFPHWIGCRLAGKLEIDKFPSQRGTRPSQPHRWVRISCKVVQWCKSSSLVQVYVLCLQGLRRINWRARLSPRSRRAGPEDKEAAVVLYLCHLFHHVSQCY